MTRLQLIPDCPFGGCEDGYCACFECDLDDLEVCGELDPQDAELAAAIRAGAEVMTDRGRLRLVETVAIPIDHYPPATT
ncbi:hypothetical protein [Streptomyces scabiei]|uniref:hypothetical protein n=1 Tax=Streptomyces scabiei TaxID=1930 RepID=UPI0029BDC1B8|nr:hypothetical protein [Streptomyces scabiei]MDX3202098.1 hypothetical protein [Streptomyces scabiei]MDX3217711.1 hypothetical protein [Streptomyces scabiei]